MPSAPVPPYWYSSKVIDSPWERGKLVLYSTPDAWFTTSLVRRRAPEPGLSAPASRPQPGTGVAFVSAPAVKQGTPLVIVAPLTGALVVPLANVSENSGGPPTAPRGGDGSTTSSEATPAQAVASFVTVRANGTMVPPPWRNPPLLTVQSVR